MLPTSKRLIATGIGMLLVAAACSSSHNNVTSGGPTTTNAARGGQSTTTVPGSAAPGSKGTYTVGLYTDQTGPAASGNKTSDKGVEAGIAWAATQGYTIKYVTADTASSPTGALSAAKKLVEQDHVDAVLSVSSLMLLASNYLTSQGVPVIGAAEDGPEWITSKNMFSVFGPTDTTKVATTFGDFFKAQGATTVGSLGYGISPQSANVAKAIGISVQNAGLKVGYVNANFPFGSTNVAPQALAMKSAGVDAFTASVDPNTGFALVTALRQSGANLKVALLPTGYGGDLQQAGPGALQAAQNVYFLSSWEPMEMNTPATQQFQNALKTVGITGDPTYAEYAGYTSVLLLVKGLDAAGANASHATIINGLSGITNWDSGGLFGSRSIDLSHPTAAAIGVDNCIWITKLSGSTFELVNGADPICGTIIPGKTVSPNS
jgi:ABC-type branched-subunit amino acid transport system substrate-binding protein